MTSFDIGPLIPREELINFGDNFSELFHGEFSDFIECPPIIDLISPPCPKNLKAIPNTTKNRITLFWYYPIHYNTTTIQNDIKTFAIYRAIKNGSDLEYQKLQEIKVPYFIYQPENQVEINEMYNDGIMFSIKAIDYHNLESNFSEIILVKLNKDYDCRKKEIDPIIISRGCSESRNDDKLIVLKNRALLKDNVIRIKCGNFVGFVDQFKNNSTTFRIRIKDLNTNQQYINCLVVTHYTTFGAAIGVPGSTADVARELGVPSGIGGGSALTGRI